MQEIASALIVGIIGTILFEVLKYLFIFSLNRIQEKKVPFSISGYWHLYIEESSENNGNKYYAHELIKFKYYRGNIHMRLYQMTNEKNYIYQGTGCMRINKLSIAYEQSNDSNSNHIGAFILKASNIEEHSVTLVGNYCEFRQEENHCSIFDVQLHPMRIKLINRLLLFLLKSKYAFGFMEKEFYEK